MGMPLLTGIEWQKATQSEKVAFVWGVCHAGGREFESRCPRQLWKRVWPFRSGPLSHLVAYRSQVTRKLEYVLNANDTHM